MNDVQLYPSVKCIGKGAGQHLAFCMKEGKEIDGRRILATKMKETTYRKLIKERQTSVKEYMRIWVKPARMHIVHKTGHIFFDFDP